MSHFVHDNGFANLTALAEASTQLHVVFVQGSVSEAFKTKVEEDLKSAVHVSWYTGLPGAEADVYALAPPEDVLAAIARHAKVLRAVVERRNGEKV